MSETGIVIVLGPSDADMVRVRATAQEEAAGRHHATLTEDEPVIGEQYGCTSYSFTMTRQ